MVSIIINTKNEEENIAKALKSIFEQTFNRDLMEVIVVDNRSGDRTAEIAREFGAQVYSHGPERSAQKNFGAAKARGKYLFFMDADMILSPGVIAEAVKKMSQNSNLAGLYINERVIGGRVWSKVRNFERSFYRTTPIDAVRFLRRDDFLERGGFDENLFACEDWDLHKRVIGGRRMDILNALVYHNEEKINLKKMIAKKKYYSGSFEKYISKWGRDDPSVKKQFGFWYRYVQVFFESGKWKKILAHPILYLSVLGIKFFIGFIYLNFKYGKQNNGVS